MYSKEAHLNLGLNEAIQKKNLTASGREIIEKLPKLGQILIVHIFDSFWTVSQSDDFGSSF